MEQFGRYELSHRLAAGGMAEIFLASTVSIEGFQKQLIIKRMLPKWSKEKNFVAKFIDEAKLCAKLHHSNIVQVFDFGRHDDHYFLALEYVYGIDLAEMIREARRRRRRVPDTLAAYIIEGVCTGLDFAHEYRDPNIGALNIVHRDVSPGNILITFSGQMKVADFGIAIATVRSSSTEPGTIHGKVAYMSPEQARGEPLDRRTDLYSTGLILYELVTGVRALQSPNVRDLLRMAQHPSLQPAESFRDDLSPDLADIIHTALAIDRKDRYKTCQDFAEALQRYRVRHTALESSLTLGRFIRELFPEGPPEKRGAENKKRKTRGIDPNKTVKKLASEALAMTEVNTAWERQAAPYLKRIIAEPNVWTLVELAEEAQGRGLDATARGLYRAAAAKFTQQGLLLPALTTYRSLMEAEAGTRGSHIEKEIVQLRRMKGRSNRELAPLAAIDDPLIGAVVSKIFFDPDDESPPVVVPPPAVLADLSDEEFLALIRVVRVRHADAGAVLLSEGQNAQSLYLIAKGRVVVTAKNGRGDSFTVESLTHGDVFGESGFFGGASRVNVLAFDAVDYFEIKRTDLMRIAESLPNIRRRIEAVYKERVADALLWQSPLFGVLSAKERKRLLEGAAFRPFARGDVVVEAGDNADDIHIVKAGSLAAYEGKNKVRNFGVNQVFGEVTALHRVPQPYTVRALTESETLVVSGGTLWRILRKNPDAKKSFDLALGSRDE
jgi:serine/threonine protein kinase/CRP-like cAMP-binding protein